MELATSRGRKRVVAFCELIGTAMFVYMLILSMADLFAVPIVLFVLILLFGGVTGGSFNPAVTLGIYINEAKWVVNLPYLVIITAA